VAVPIIIIMQEETEAAQLAKSSGCRVEKLISIHKSKELGS